MNDDPMPIFVFVLRLTRAYELEKTVLVEAKNITVALAAVIDEFGSELVSFSTHEVTRFHSDTKELIHKV